MTHHIPIYGTGMHDHVLDSLELGERVAASLDAEACGFGALFDRVYDQYMEREKAGGRLIGPTDPCPDHPSNPWRPGPDTRSEAHQ